MLRQLKQDGLTGHPASAQEGAARPSIAQLVLQRMERKGVVQTVFEEPSDKPHIKVSQASTSQMPVAPEPQGMKAVGDKPWPKNWPSCPKNCNPMEWRRALENKEYYELKQIEDEGRKPWHQYPKHPYQYSEFVYVTPEMAQVVLDHMPLNRPWKEAWSDAIARDVLNERWLQTHESLAINTQGELQDGQHRGRGIIKAGKGWPIYITWNVPPESIYVIDSGDKRKINEKLGLLFPESKLTQKTAALCRSMMWGLASRGLRYSESEIAEFAIKHQQTIVWIATNLRGFRADLQAVVGKALLWWGEAAMAPFVQRLRTVQFNGDGDPAKALYLWLQKAKQEGKRTHYASPIVYYRKTLAAVYAHISSRDANKLYQKQDDIFEWLPGWGVPEEAPCKGEVFDLPRSQVSQTPQVPEQDSTYEE